MLYYLSTKEYVSQNESFESYLKRLEKGVRDCLYATLPSELTKNNKVDYRLRELETAVLTSMMKFQEPIYDPSRYRTMEDRFPQPVVCLFEGEEGEPDFGSKGKMGQTNSE
jgi:hypothetical protein